MRPQSIRANGSSVPDHAGFDQAAGGVAIKAKDVERADALARAHTRQLRDNFIDFMKENYATDIAPGGIKAAE